MLRSILSEKLRILKFFIVGLSGTFINLTFVLLGNTFFFKILGEPHQTWLSYALAIFISIFSNYMFNYLWTWKDRRGPGIAFFLLHLGKYYLTNLVAGSIQFLIANGITFFISFLLYDVGDGAIPVFWKMGASLAGIGIAGVINFLLNHFWNFNVSDNQKNNVK